MDTLEQRARDLYERQYESPSWRHRARIRRLAAYMAAHPSRRYRIWNDRQGYEHARARYPGVGYVGMTNDYHGHRIETVLVRTS